MLRNYVASVCSVPNTVNNFIEEEMKPFRPQKAPSESILLEQLSFPMLASFKLDGIRCTINDLQPKSTSNKPLPSAWAKRYCRPEFEGLDGELVVANPTPGKVYQESMSAVMTQGGMIPLTFHVFDMDMEGQYSDRLRKLISICDEEPHIEILEQWRMNSIEEILQYEDIALNAGYEGLMIRSFTGYYKRGRCTLKEYNIFKFVRHLTAEAEVVGLYEQLENQNEKVTSETGLSKRSTHQANKVGKGTLGGFNCVNLSDGVSFDIGTGEGLDAGLRAEIWSNKEKYIGKILKYRYKPYGVKDKPRQPIWIGWRDPMDM